jgi:hypothetical protein
VVLIFDGKGGDKDNIMVEGEEEVGVILDRPFYIFILYLFMISINQVDILWIEYGMHLILFDMRIIINVLFAK